MNKIWTILSVVLIISLSMAMTGCKKNTFNLSWADKGISVDGNDSDWDNYGKVYDQETGSSLGMINDDKYIWILIKKKMPERMPVMPVSIWLNDEAKKKKIVGISYPARKGREENKIKRNSQLQGDPGDWNLMPDQFQNNMMDNNEIQITLGDKENFFIIPGDSKEGIKVKQDKQQGLMITEIQIPMNYVPDEKYSFETIPGQKISIGFETMKERSGRPGRSGGKEGMGGRGGRGGMGGGGRMPGGGKEPGGRPGAPGGPGGRKMANTELKWAKIILAGN